MRPLVVRSIVAVAAVAVIAVGVTVLAGRPDGSTGAARATSTTSPRPTTTIDPEWVAMTSCDDATRLDGGYQCIHDRHIMFSRFPYGTEALPRERKAAERFARSVQTNVESKFRNVDAARAAGYTLDDRMEWLKYNAARPEAAKLRELLPNGVVTHLFNLDYLRDDVIADPTRPEAIVYITDGHRYVLAGALFVTPLGQHGPQMGGPLTIWHKHPGAGCWDGAVFVGFGVDASGRCLQGSTTTWTPEMLHVWVERPTAEQSFHMDVSPSWVSSVFAAAPPR